MTRLNPPCEACEMCGGIAWNFEARFTEPPRGETDLGLAPYCREVWSCGGCGHVINHHDMDLSKIYSKKYWDQTYADRVRSTYDRIMSLPEDQSDNQQRVAFINEYWSRHHTGQARTLLDIGAGLAVFPAAMRERGWSCTALDPDPRAAEHARQAAQVDAIAADFMEADLSRKFSLVSLNKVLEHVPEPVSMLGRVREVLHQDGLVYLELPDGEAALKDTPARQEMFLEHYCAYSMASMALLILKSGFRCDYLDRLRQRSGKYTLRAFLRRPQ